MLVELPLHALQRVHPAVEERVHRLDLLQRPLDLPKWLRSPADLSAFLLAVPPWAMASQVGGQTDYQILFGGEYLPLLRRHYPPTHQVPVLVFTSPLSHAQVLREHAVATAGVFERGQLSTAEVVSALLNDEVKAVGLAAGAGSPDRHRLPAGRAGAATTPSGVSTGRRALAAGAAPRPDAPTRARARRPRVPAPAAAQPGSTDSTAVSPSGHEVGLPPKG